MRSLVTLKAGSYGCDDPWISGWFTPKTAERAVRSLLTLKTGTYGCDDPWISGVNYTHATIKCSSVSEFSCSLASVLSTKHTLSKTRERFTVIGTVISINDYLMKRTLSVHESICASPAVVVS